MLSFLSQIKSSIRNKISHIKLRNRSTKYQVILMGSDTSNIDNNETDSSLSSSSGPNNDSVSDTSPRSPPISHTPPPISPTKIQCLFGKDIDTKLIKNDYELQSLLLKMKHRCIDIEDIRLETRIEEAIENIPNASDIFKIKMRIIYIIIALDCYSEIFEEKKNYRAVNSRHYLGVFRYNDYIIRIDDTPYSFINESTVLSALSNSKPDHIVLPFLTYTNIKRDTRNNVCECNANAVCHCRYVDDADHHEKINAMSHEGKHYYNILRKSALSFSIQHYAKNTEQLYNWVKDNIGNSVYNQFSKIQYSFFVDLFLKCANVIRDLHAVNVVHGDIKPDNILIREHDNFNLYHSTKYKNFNVYLIDFGLSGIKNDGYGTGGTVPYCHPEFKNIRDTNKSGKYNWKKQQLKHDVWSLGIIFITLYIYRDFYNYYYKYPDYFFTKDGYVSSLILDVITESKLHDLFTKMLSNESISINEVCVLLEEMAKT